MGLAGVAVMQPDQPNDRAIIVVSGLPRSGTSLMMKMLEAGGVPILTDNIRQANLDNPEGYYEYELVKGLDKGESGWLAEARGRAVKVISALLVHLPPGYTYKVLLMRRNMAEVLSSQWRMLQRADRAADAPNDEQMAAVYAKHMQRVMQWLTDRPNFTTLEVDYNRLMSGDADAMMDDLVEFLAMPLAIGKMQQAINPLLYRNRL